LLIAKQVYKLFRCPLPGPAAIDARAKQGQGRLAICAALAAASILMETGLALHAPFLRDEAQTIFIARLPHRTDVIEALARDGGAPLFYFLLRYWMRVAGSGAGIRWLPILLSSVTPAIIFLVGENLAGRTAGLAAAVWWLVNPVAVDAGAQVRMYCLAGALGTLTLWAWIRFLSSGRLHYGVAGAAGGIALLYTHNTGLVLLATVQIGWLAWAITARRRQALNARLMLRWAALQAVIVLVYLPWAPVLLRQISYDVTPWAGNIGIKRMLVNANCFFPLPVLSTAVPVAIVAAAGVIGATLYVFQKPEMVGLRPALALPVTGIAALAAATCFRGAFGPRYILPWVPMLAISLFALTGTALRKSLRRLTVAILIACQAIGLIFASNRLAQPTNAPEIGKILTRNSAGAENVIVIPWEAGAPAISYYLPPKAAEQIGFPTQGRVEIINWAFLKNRLSDDRAFAAFLHRIAAEARRRKTLWLICQTAALESSPVQQSQTFVNLERSRQRDTIIWLESVAGRPALQLRGCDCGYESFALLRFEPSLHAKLPEH